jgi:hypothetical protein
MSSTRIATSDFNVAGPKTVESSGYFSMNLAANSLALEVVNPLIASIPKSVSQWFEYNRTVWSLSGNVRQTSQQSSDTSSGQKRLTERFLPRDERALRHPKLIKLARGATFSALQEWEGYVVAIFPTHFVANLVNLTAGSSRADEEAEIPLDEIDQHDIENLKIGGVFRWAIGYQRQPAGTKARISQIVFRQLPQWTKREMQEAEAEATEMASFLNNQINSSDI